MSAENKKMKVIHIHTDKKFVGDSKRFEGSTFINKTIVITESPVKISGIEGNVTFYKNSEFKKIIAACENADLVVLYDLNYVKCRIALALPEEIKIAWRFFGYELYGRDTCFLSEKSIENSKKSFKKKLQEGLAIGKSLVRLGETPDSLFWKAVKRVNLMLILSIEEFQLLKKKWEILPDKAVKLSNKPYDVEFFDFYKIKNKERRQVIIGNNRSAYNNHIDILDIVNKIDKKKDYDFTLFFNYGSESYYSNYVKELALDRGFNLITDFLSLEEFSDVYNEASALVINGYRQMAVANIFQGILRGVKVYLNEKNAFYHWLIKEGFKVYSISNFKKDIEEDNLNLSESDILINFELLKNLSKKYPAIEFQEKIHDFLV